jgi:ribosomal protein L29
MEFKELQKKKESDLHKLLAESRDTLRDLRFKVASKQQKDVSAIKKIKRVISNIMTLLIGKKSEIAPEVKPIEEKK